MTKKKSAKKEVEFLPEEEDMPFIFNDMGKLVIDDDPYDILNLDLIVKMSVEEKAKIYTTLEELISKDYILDSLTMEVWSYLNAH